MLPWIGMLDTAGQAADGRASGHGHYGGRARIHMDVGEAIGKAMVELLGKPAQ